MRILPVLGGAFFALPLFAALPSSASAQTLTGTAAAACQLTVSGTAIGYKGVPFTAVTIEFVPPGGSAVRLGTVRVANNQYSWTGAVPGYTSIPANSTLKLTTNRQYSTTIPAPACSG